MDVCVQHCFPVQQIKTAVVLQVSLTVDHPQKVLVLGEAQDYGTCKAAKKNGEPCSQIVNMVGS